MPRSAVIMRNPARPVCFRSLSRNGWAISSEWVATEPIARVSASAYGVVASTRA